MSASLDALLHRLESLDVRLWVEAGQLRFSAPKGVVQGELRDALLASKADLVARLSAAGKVPTEDVVLPASANQEMLWSLDRLETDAPALYIEARAVRLRGALDVVALEAAVNALCRRHAILRTRLEMRDGALCQIVAPTLAVALPVEEAGGLDPAALDARVNEIAWAPFDLAQAPALRVHPLRLGERDWILVLAQHHAMTDRWSIALLVRELSVLYAACREGRPSPLPPVAQYGDYARRQRERLSGERGAALLDHWRRTLADAPPLLALPTDRPYPSRPSHRGGRIAVPLAPSLRDGVDALCRREAVTPFMVFAAAFAALLHRMTGQDSVVLGTPVANRLSADLEEALGCFVNTLALRINLDGQAGFPALLAEVRDRALDAYEHQDLPFNRLLDALRPERGAGHPPVFQAMIVLQNVGMAALSFGDAALEPQPLRPADSGKFPLLLTILPEEPGGPLLCWDFQTDLFDEATVAGIARRFTVLLADALAAPERPLARLALRTPEDDARLLAAANRGHAPVPADATIATLFARQAALTPDATALRFGERRLDYRALDRLAERLAGQLRHAGVGRGDRVGVALDRSPELVAALLAVAKSGAVYVPLDRRYPAERLAWMTEDSGIGLLVTDAAGAAAGSGGIDIPRLLVDGPSPDSGEDAPPPDPGPNPDPGIDADSPAYIMYTSGSTGRPKGVVVPHRGVVRLVKGADYARFGADEVILQLAPVSFDASTLEIWGSLLNGGTLLIAPPGNEEPEALGRLIREGGVTTLWLTSALFSLMIDSVADDLRGLRQLLAGGDSLSPRHVAEALARLPGTVLINGYGPTENTTFTCCHRFGQNAPATIPVGRPIAGTTVYILDAQGTPVPPGVAGELLTGGDGLAIGYHGRPDLTAERFVTLELALDGQRWTERLYRTGDRARWIPDPATGGLTVELLGRMDRQVKIRGFRIEPGEVEAQLGALPGIADAAVVVRRDGDGQPRLVAYCVPAKGTEAPDPRAALARRLPDYMVPAQFVTLNALPVTPNGKTDRAALASDRFRIVADPTGGAPATPTETLLAALWAEILGGGPVHRGDHFFERGGNSLSAIRMIARAREALAAAGRPHPLPVRRVFEHPTLEALARDIDETGGDDGSGGNGSGDGESNPPLAPRGLGRSGLPLSHAQERLWVLETMLPMGGAYNVPGQYRLDGPLDVARLETALRAIVRRHDALSAVFTERDGRGVQRIADPDLRLTVHDCAAEELPRLLDEGAAAPFDLERGPPIRAALLRTGPDTHHLQLVMHHLVCDGWSVALFLRELEALYAGRSLPPLPVQYQDFADWHRGWLSGRRLERLLGYWRGKLAGLPDTLDLPADFPRPALSANRGATRTFAIDTAPAAMDRLCRERNVTRFMLVYAVFAALLHRLTGQGDFGVGTPIAGRHHPGVEPLIGFFADTLVLRTPVGEDESFTALLDRARRTVLEAFDHQDLPFTALVEALKPGRRLDSTPLFQVMLAVEEDEAPFALTLPGLTAAPVAWDSPFAKHDLTLTLQPAGAGFTGSLEYNADLFHPDSVARIGRRFAVLLAAVLADADRPLASIDLRDDAERARPPGLAGASQPRPSGVGLHDLIAEQARRTPDAVALCHGGATLSHGAVEAAANRLAHRLIALGLKPGGLVGVHRHRSLDLPVILLAILKAGGGYVPLNPAHPAARVAAILRTARPALVIAGPGFPLGDSAATLLDPDAEAEAIARHPGSPPAVPSDGERIAYVMFTSGSTGTPKGVAVPHRALVNHQLWFRRTFELTAADALLQMTAFDFDASVIEMFAPLLCGGRLVIAPPDSEKDPAALRGLIRSGGVTLFQAVPALLQVMAEEGLLDGCPALRVVCSGGEALATALQDRLLARIAPARLFNLYGPTETCIDAAFRPCGPGLRQATVPIGRPIDNMRAYVLDERLRPVPDGMAGELFLSGESLAAGYLNEPALTAAAFLPDPFAGGKARMYRTGDRARLGPDGLEFLGRLDRQIKLRGFRIETTEIEAALNAVAGVRESAVVGVRRPGDSDHRLVAFVVGATPDGAALRARLKRTLPEHMVPARVVGLDVLPLASSGKIDRRRLEALAGIALSEAHAPAERTPPRTDAERRLAAIWQEVLGTAAIGVHDNFFELGGHSLMAVRVVARIRDRWPASGISVRHVFEAPTVAELAARLEILARNDGGDARPPMVPVPRRLDADGSALMPLSHSQRALWFLDRLEGGGRAYTTVGAFRLDGRLDVAALTRALDALMARHEALRTSFVLRDEEPWQRIMPPLPMPFSRKAVAATDGAAAGGRVLDDQALGDLALAEAARPIDLSREPPLRFTLIELAPGRHLGVLTWHHIASDGWSLGVFVREVGALYAAFLGGREADLPPLPLHYADYAAWQARWLAGPGFAAQLDHWKRQLDGAPAHLNLCTDRPRPHRQSFHGATIRFRVEADLTRRLLAVGQAGQASLFMILLAVFMVLLHRHSRQDDVLVGTPVANRPATELEGLIGFFTNTLVLRGRMADNPRFADFLNGVRQTALDAFANPDVPFETLVDALDPPRSLSHAPLFQAMFNLQNTPLEPVDLPGLTLSPLEIDTRTAKFDLLLTLIGTDGDLDGHWEYSSDLFDPHTAQRMADRYVALLRAVAEDPELRLRALPLLSDAERDRLLAACRGPAREADGAGLHHLFEETARRLPDAVAVEFAGHAPLTYRHLDRWSNALAHRLVELGVRPDTPVGIRLDRSLEMVVAVLGILKAGGAYVPLDAALPPARLAFIVENAGLTLAVGGAPIEGLPESVRIVPAGSPEEEDSAAPAVALSPENLAYILHTSGSTGQPKGVLMPHRALVNLIRWQVAEPSFRPGLRTLQFTTLGFDVACQEIFATWASGGTLVLMEEALRRDVPAMLARAAGWGIERIFLPFTALQQMAEAWPLAAVRPMGLRELLTAGERLTVTPALRRMARDLPGCRLVNQYGPTETHVATALVLPDDPESWPELPRIGRPVANSAVYVLDEDGRPLPPGVPGQVWIAGAAVGRGYLNRPDLTDDAFRPDPFGNGTMYATGDLGCLRWDADAARPEIDFLGRIDQQVKVRGYRIEPEEVERALVAQGRAREAAVVAWTDGGGEKRLVAYYVPADAEAGDPAAVRDGLATLLPDYMIPTLWVPLPALPQTRSGKVDRKALPPPDRAAARRGPASAAAPGTATERTVAEVWRTVLQVPRVGLHDNFFDLGGYSFLLLKVLAEIRRRFPEAGQVTMVALFEHPTVQALARLIDGTRDTAGITHRAEARRTGAALRLSLRDRRTALRHGDAADIVLDRKESTR